MTAEAQRIAIAEACGWQGPHHPENIAGMDGWWLQHRGIWWVTPDKNRVLISGVPDYLNDLNACHEFEKILSTTPIYMQKHAFNNYATMLCEMCKHEYNAIAATAAQRCEAFLKTINKWTNDR